jgi:hypothetical protein
MLLPAVAVFYLNVAFSLGELVKLAYAMAK